RHRPEAERVLPGRPLLHLLRPGGAHDPRCRPALRRGQDPLRLRLLPLGLRLPRQRQADRRARGPERAGEEAHPRRQRRPSLQPLARRAGRNMAYEHGKITDEGVARIREAIGHTFTGRQPWRTEVTRDAIWHLAHAIGDLSPLYTDEEYARKTRWGRLLCPGVMLNTMDVLRAPGSAGLPEGLPGVHAIWSGSHYEWERPLMLGDRVTSECYLKDVVERESRMSDGRTIYQTYEAKYRDREGTYIGKRSDTYMRVDRVKAKEKSVYREAGRLAHWTPADIDRFQQEYRAETRTVERWWEDVRVGDELGRI